MRVAMTLTIMIRVLIKRKMSLMNPTMKLIMTILLA